MIEAGWDLLKAEYLNITVVGAGPFTVPTIHIAVTVGATFKERHLQNAIALGGRYQARVVIHCSS